MRTLRRSPVRAAIEIRSALLLAVILVASLVAGDRATAIAATQAPTFVRTDYPLLGNNHIAADLNGDGRLDLAGSGTFFAVVMLSNGEGTFGAKVEYPVGDEAQDLDAGDFDGDGKVDLVVAINDAAIGLSLLKGNGDGSFNAPVNFANTWGFDSPDVVAVDLNNDGKLDVVIAHQIACYTAPCIAARTISIMIGNGDGTFQPTREMDVGTGMSRIAVGDFNRDGIKDLAIAGNRAQVYRLQGVGDGTFTQLPTLTLIEDNFGVDGTDIDVADFNGDSIQDLVVAIALNGSKTAVLIGNGDGTFRPPLIIQEPNLRVPQVQAVADYNGDGFQDLAIGLADGTQGLMEILNGNGDGTFQPPVFFLIPPPKSSIGTVGLITANLNSDTKPDLALSIGGASISLAVLINSTGVVPPPTPSAPTLVSPAQDATPPQPVAFDWTDVGAATSYQIHIDDSNKFSTPLVVDAKVTASQFTAPTLAAKRHWWRVRGINSAGVAGPWSRSGASPRSPPP
jgi:FG-GAP-like repeat